MQSGFSLEDFDAKPVVGIVTTWSEANPCHAHLRDVADAVKRGIWSAGGFPLEIPVMSLGETLMKPTTMLYRNLAAIETEEVLRFIRWTQRCSWAAVTRPPRPSSWVP